MISKISLVLALCFLPFYASATAYYEVTGPTGETSYQPFFSLPQSVANFSFNPAVAGGGAVAFVVTLFILYCCGSVGGTSFLKTLDFEDHHAAEEDPVVPAPAKKNSTKRSRRHVNRYQSRIIRSAQEPGHWGL